MIDFKLDHDDDVVFDIDDIAETSGIDEVMQAVSILLKTRMGEFFADEEMGLDTEYVLGKAYNEAYATGAITDAMQKDSRVTAVNDISLTVVENRNLVATVEFMADDRISSTEVMILA
ncbi:contractile injection system sheath initiator [Lacticaseibacillus saniviri]|uniref:DUF2634 domain-containing protein n=1 Tax=Lacticaseibacillus saniviri JCM 17471 = DSM 24301 TaxID=1293598 RepID=A0A0R2MQL9_9LACO|nr:DUF2634 domain-containing protein [Lacticaseibacillus saniviri]KRO15908.1 hypothetical protein IV56_GL002099 [Lacticaseibacillus saniviri JCM 17471 = DSM 24301]